jgi:hypothetical protein
MNSTSIDEQAIYMQYIQVHNIKQALTRKLQPNITIYTSFDKNQDLSPQ